MAENQTTININNIFNRLTYKGDIKDIILNYIILIVAIIYLFDNKYKKKYDIYFLIGLLLFQIILCIPLKCIGISIVWNTLVSYIFIRNIRGNYKIKNLLLLIIPAFIINLHYYINYEPLETIAHILSLILGIFIGIIFY